LVRLLEKQTNSLDSQAQSRFQHLLEISLRRENPDSLIVTREWIDASNPILRKVALRTIGRSLAMDPIGARTFLESIHQGERISVLESLFSRVQGENLPEMIHQTADLMLEQEYRGSALLSSFSRGTQLDLETLVYQRGAEESSENYRNLVLYASQGGIDRGGEITSLWANNLDRIARTDPSRSVRCTALRVRALSWPLSDIGGFVQLIQRSDVDPRTAEIAHALMMARQSTR
jgi:hypothetical protein